MPQMRFTQVRARALILLPKRFDMRARALNQTKLAVAKPTMNTDSKSTDIPYRPSKAPGIARRTTLLMIAYGDACGGGGGGGEPHRHAGAPPSPVHETEQARNASRRGGGSKGERERCFVIDSERR